MIRAYAPLIGSTFAAAWPLSEPTVVFAPSAAERQLTGEALELAEYRAMDAAAASIAADAVAAGSPRAVVAVDLPESALASAAEVVAGVVMTQALLDPSRVASVHIDDPEGFTSLGDDREAALAALAESDLLWFHSTEIDQLIELLSQLGADDGLQR